MKHQTVFPRGAQLGTLHIIPTLHATSH